MGTVCLSINLRNKAVTQYHGFNFSSMALWRGGLYGAAPGVGLCSIGEQHDTDNGAPIPASLSTFANDLGYPGPKAIRSATVVIGASNRVAITCTADQRRTVTKNIPILFDGEEPHGRQVTMPRTVFGTSIDFSIANVNGGDFTLYGLYATVIKKHIGFSRVKR